MSVCLGAHVRAISVASISSTMCTRTHLHGLAVFINYQHDAANMSSLTPNFLSCSLLGLSTAKRKFAESLNEFKFQCIGDAETDDEICIGE